jgi:hypothetical protein
MRKRTSPPVGLDIINIPTEAKLGFSATAGSSAVCNFANARSTCAMFLSNSAVVPLRRAFCPFVTYRRIHIAANMDETLIVPPRTQWGER